MLAVVCVLGGLGLQEGRGVEELVRAWEGLAEGDRQDCVDWFVAECDRGSQFRDGLERFVLRQFEGDPFDWPEKQGVVAFDPAVHAPAQVIPRRFVDESSPRWRREREKLIGDWVERDWVAAFEYDWGLGTVVRLGQWDDPARIARNAAAGFSPYTDLVEALVERALDDGEVRDEALAFSHAYSDREGNAFPTVTLYDAWSSGTTLEMPDVECLGIVHSLDEDWRTWRAPVPGAKQNSLYEHIGKHFSRLRRHRALRTSLARTYLEGSPALPSGWGTALGRLNGFWELHEADPAKLAQDLPRERDWTKWLTKRGNEVDRDGDIVERAKARREALLASRAWARRTFEGILTEYGAFDSPSSSDEEEGDGGGGEDARTP